MDGILRRNYLWNEEYATLSPDFGLPYDEFLDGVLMRMRTNDLDKKFRNGRWQLYSNIQRLSPVSRTALSADIDSQFPKEPVYGFGIVSLAIISYTDNGGAETGQYGFAVMAVYPDSPMARAGLGRGTIINQVDGQWITAGNLNTQAARVEAARMKFLATPEEKNPNMRFVNNRFIEQLRNCDDYKDYHEKKPVTWTNEPEFLRDFSERIVKSELYKEYMDSSDDSYENDCEFWKKALRALICTDEELTELLEQKSLYWNDDLEIITTFVLKTIKQFSEENGGPQSLLPMFKDDDDAEFAKELFRNTLIHGGEYRNYIENFIKNWEIERVAFMDIVIMMVALSEFHRFPSIPTRVTLNEYIELAKAYSTSKSGQFVNGVLNAIADNLKKEGVLTKE